MSTLRSLQRGAIKNKCYKKNGNTKAFNNEWERIHYGHIEEKDEEGNVIATKLKKAKIEKKKQRHMDDGRAYTKYLKAWKSMIDNMKANKSNAREKVC